MKTLRWCSRNVWACFALYLSGVEKNALKFVWTRMSFTFLPSWRISPGSYLHQLYDSLRSHGALKFFCRKTERLVLFPVCHGLHVINKLNQDPRERIVLVGFVHIFNSCYFTSHSLDTWSRIFPYRLSVARAWKKKFIFKNIYIFI